MIKKIVFLFFISAIILCSCGLGTQSNEFSFNLSAPENTDQTKLSFTPGEYSMTLERVAIMAGTNSGIEIKWAKDEGSNSQLVFIVFLPSSDNFRIWNSSLDMVEVTAPELPFTLTEKDFDSIYSSRIKQKINAYISLNRETQIMSDQTSVDYLTFPSFTLEISKLEFDKNAITMACKFTGKLTDEYKEIVGTDYSISGEFSLNNIKTGIMEVDD